MSYVYMNPGTGPVAGASLKRAWSNIRAFRRELTDATGCRYQLERVTGKDEGDGRYVFRLSRGRHRCVVDMPGCDLDVLTAGRGLPPRLYVDGGSWTWQFGVSVALSQLGHLT